MMKENFSRRNVMLGVLKNKQQEVFNLQHRFYHIPEEWLRKRKLPKYVAIIADERAYRPEETGVVFYGKIVEAELFRRYELNELPTKASNLSKLYWNLKVENWMRLETPIKIGGVGIDVNAFTSEFQFFNAKDTAELLLTNKKHWEFYKVCSDMFDDAKLLGPFEKPEVVKFDKYIAKLKRNKIVILREKEEVKTLRLFRKTAQDFRREISLLG